MFNPPYRTPPTFKKVPLANTLWYRPLSFANARISLMCNVNVPNPKKFTARPMTKRVAWRYPQILREMNNLEGDEDVRDLIRKK